MLKNPIILTLLLIVFFSGALAGAYLLGQNKGGGSSSSTSSLNKNEKRLRAKAGTERKNARALTTSRKSSETERTDEKAEIWGSLEKGKPEQPKKVSLILSQAETAMKNLPTDESIQKISSIILAQENNNLVAIPYAMLGYLYIISDPQLRELSVETFRKSLELGETDFQRVEIFFYYAKALIHQEKYQETLDLIGNLSITAIPKNPHYFELGILAAIAMERLGEDEKAQMTYKELMETIQIHHLNDYPDIDNVFRMAAYKLAKLYRKNGLDNSALALARQISRHKN